MTYILTASIKNYVIVKGANIKDFIGVIMEYLLIKLEYLCRKLYGFVWRLRIRLTMNLEKKYVRRSKRRNKDL